MAYAVIDISSMTLEEFGRLSTDLQVEISTFPHEMTGDLVLLTLG